MQRRITKAIDTIEYIISEAEKGYVLVPDSDEVRLLLETLNVLLDWTDTFDVSGATSKDSVCFSISCLAISSTRKDLSQKSAISSDKLVKILREVVRSVCEIDKMDSLKTTKLSTQAERWLRLVDDNFSEDLGKTVNFNQESCRAQVSHKVEHDAKLQINNTGRTLHLLGDTTNATNKVWTQAERQKLFQTLSKLPTAQYEEIVFATNFDPQNDPTGASTGNRVSAFLKWAKSPVGCGLDSIDKALQEVLRNNQSND